MNIEAEISKLWEKLNCLLNDYEKNGFCTITDTIEGHKIALHNNEKNILTVINETVTKITTLEDGNYLYVNEEGNEVIINTSGLPPKVFNSYDTAFATLGPNRPFIYSKENLDGVPAFLHAWTVN
jgi:hypothetical protein